MRILRTVALSTMLGVATLAATGASAHQAGGATEPGADPAAACARMMEGMSKADQEAMGKFMQSDRAPQMMSRMMQTAKRMGNGDVMAGMSRMMDMMGSMGRGGMMGGGKMGQGGMMQRGGSGSSE